MSQTSLHSQLIGESEFAVRCRGVTKEFGSGQTRTRYSHGIDLEIPAGQQTFIVGPSGCGKTTLVSVIAGLLDVTDGPSNYCTSLDTLRGAALVNFRAINLGFIFQQFNLLPRAQRTRKTPLFHYCVQGCHAKRQNPERNICLNDWEWRQTYSSTLISFQAVSSRELRSHVLSSRSQNSDL